MTVPEFLKSNWENSTIPTMWAHNSYKWGYTHFKWPYKWGTGVSTLLMGVIKPCITGRGPPCNQPWTSWAGCFDWIFDSFWFAHLHLIRKKLTSARMDTAGVTTLELSRCTRPRARTLDLFGGRGSSIILNEQLLVGGFNPFEKYSSNWIISPGRGENEKCLKPPRLPWTKWAIF